MTTPTRQPPPPLSQSQQQIKTVHEKIDVDWSVFRNPSLYSFCSPGCLIIQSIILELGALVAVSLVWCFDNEFSEIVLEVIFHDDGNQLH